MAPNLGHGATSTAPSCPDKKTPFHRFQNKDVEGFKAQSDTR